MHEGNKDLIDMDKRLQDDYRFIYKVVVDGIKESQDAQWRCTTFAIGIFGVMATIYRITLRESRSPDVFDALACTLFGVVVMLFTSWLIYQQERRLSVNRKRLAGLREFLHDDVKKIVVLETVHRKMGYTRASCLIQNGFLLLGFALFVYCVFLS